MSDAARLLWQQELLGRVIHVGAVFHEPIPNNYVWQLIPKRFEREAYCRKMRSETSSLNIADELLLAICEGLSVRELAIPGVTRHLQFWRRCIEHNVNLASITHVTEIFREMRPEGYSLCEWIRASRPDAVDAFVNVPSSILDLVRLNIYVAPKDVGLIVGMIAQLAVKRPTEFALISRVEVAKLLRLGGKIDYPTVIVYFENVGDMRVDDFPRLKIVLDAIESALEKVATGDDVVVPDEYSIRWLEQATITQGFRLHKRYLKLLDSLGMLYDERYNFAVRVGASGAICRPFLRRVP